MVATACHLEQAKIALDHDGFGNGRDASKAKATGKLALIHHAGCECGFFSMLHDKGVQMCCIAECPAHHLRVGNRLHTIGKADSACLDQQPEFSHFRAAKPLGQGGHSVDIHDARVTRAAFDEVHQRYIVDHRIGVRHDDHGGNAACCRCLACE